MSGSFDALASAAVAKSATIDSNAATIAALGKANAKLTETNKRLVAQLTAAKLPFSPPGFPPNVPAQRSRGALQPSWHLARRAREHSNTGHRAQQQHCGRVMSGSQKKSNNKWYFVAPQACSTCGKPAVLHIPENCKGPI